VFLFPLQSGEEIIMAVAVVNGATVTLSLGTANLKIASLSISTGQGTFDVSAFGSGSYVDRIGGGLLDMAGSAAGFLQSGDVLANPFNLVTNTGTMLITFNTGCTVSMPVIIGSVSVDVSRAGIGIFRFDWSKADSTDPTIAWV
jgi:hypothetical protein